MYKIISPLYIQLGLKKPKNYYLNLNNYRNRHFQVSNNLKIKYKEQLQEQIEKLPVFKKINIKFTYYAGRNVHSDLENTCIIHNKFFNDALVENGKLKDDTTEYIDRIEYCYGGYDKNNGRVEIFIWEYTNV